MNENMAATVALRAGEVASLGADNSQRLRRRIRILGMGSLLLRGKTWWACYYVNGTEHRESARQPAEGFHDGSLADANGC
jgi:hypothetical protein